MRMQIKLTRFFFNFRKFSVLFIVCFAKIQRDKDTERQGHRETERSRMRGRETEIYLDRETDYLYTLHLITITKE